MSRYFRKYNYPRVQTKRICIYSKQLKREVILDSYTPQISQKPKDKLPIVLFNDGQVLSDMGISRILRKLLKAKMIQPCILLGIHSNQNRHHELGTTQYLEANGNGVLAQAYQEFIVKDLMAHLQVDHTDKIYIAGFSLGGLSALDIALNHPKRFDGVGVFSGALWWRDKSFTAKRPNAHLIIPKKIKALQYIPQQRFWFQAGTLDETSDRDKNGIIDVIDDTLRTIMVLQAKGVDKSNISYVEIKGGKHHWSAWSKAMPKFLMTICGR